MMGYPSDYLIFGGHFDLAMDLLDRRERGARQVFSTIYEPDFQAGRVNGVVSALFLHDHFLPEMALRKALDQIAVLHEEIEESEGRLVLCTSTQDILEAGRQGRFAVVLSFEGVEPLMGDLRLLRVFHALGVRGVGLTWSRRNEAADGSSFHPTGIGREGGLSPFGVKLVEEAERLKMFIDVSHINDPGFWDVMEIAEGPVVASHSNCRALCDHPRNLTDDQIRAIAERGGVIGMNALSPFVVSPTVKSRPDVSDLVDHVDHIVRLVGADFVGIGFDFDGSFEDYSGKGKAIEASDVLSGHKEIPLFVKELEQRGYSPKEIGKILGLNLMRVFEKTMG